MEHHKDNLFNVFSQRNTRRTIKVPTGTKNGLSAKWFLKESYFRELFVETAGLIEKGFLEIVFAE